MSVVMEEMNACMEAFEDAGHDLSAARFQIADEASAAWVVDKFVSYDEKLARVKAQAADMIADIEKDRDRFANRFTAELEAWFDAQPKKTKSIKLLTGTLSKRLVPGGWRITDKDATTAWALKAPKCLYSIEEVIKLHTDAIKDYAKKAYTDGELIPGVELVEDRESFSIKGVK